MSVFCYFVVVCVRFVQLHKGFKCFVGALGRKDLPCYLLWFYFLLLVYFFSSINLRVELNLGKTMTVVCKNKTIYMNTWN